MLDEKQRWNKIDVELSEGGLKTQDNVLNGLSRAMKISPDF